MLQKREELEAQPCCKEDLLATLDAWIARKGVDFPARLRPA